MTAANIIAGIIFGSIGFVAFVYGRKRSEYKPMLIGVVLMAYTYAVTNTAAVYAIGIALIAALYFWRD